MNKRTNVRARGKGRGCVVLCCVVYLVLGLVGAMEGYQVGPLVWLTMVGRTDAEAAGKPLACRAFVSAAREKEEGEEVVVGREGGKC